MKISPMGAELFHADGQKDRQTGKTKLIDAFHNFANAPKNAYKILVGNPDGQSLLTEVGVCRSDCSNTKGCLEIMWENESWVPLF